MVRKAHIICACANKTLVVVSCNGAQDVIKKLSTDVAAVALHEEECGDIYAACSAWERPGCLVFKKASGAKFDDGFALEGFGKDEQLGEVRAIEFLPRRQGSLPPRIALGFGNGLVGVGDVNGAVFKTFKVGDTPPSLQPVFLGKCGGGKSDSSGQTALGKLGDRAIFASCSTTSARTCRSRSPPAAVIGVVGDNDEVAFVTIGATSVEDDDEILEDDQEGRQGSMDECGDHAEDLSHICVLPDSSTVCWLSSTGNLFMGVLEARTTHCEVSSFLNCGGGVREGEDLRVKHIAPLGGGLVCAGLVRGGSEVASLGLYSSLSEKIIWKVRHTLRQLVSAGGCSLVVLAVAHQVAHQVAHASHLAAPVQGLRSRTRSYRLVPGSAAPDSWKGRHRHGA